MKRFKKLSLVLVLILIASIFTGCSKEEKGLLDAFMKNQEILSFESDMNLEFDLSASGLLEEEQVIFDDVAKVVNDLSLHMKQKTLSNEEQTKARAQMDLDVKLDGTNFESYIWVDADFDDENPVFKEIFKLPSLLRAMMPSPANTKEYIVLDLEEMNQAYEDMGTPVDYSEIMDLAMKYQEKFVEAFERYSKNYDSDISVVTKLDDKVIDGESVDIYQVKFDNDSFKEFLKYTTISILQDKEMALLFQEYMAEIINLSGEPMTEEDIDFTSDIPQLIKDAKEFFETLENLEILGEEGIVINYGVNKDGFIVSEEGEMDLLIDTKSIMELSSDELEEGIEKTSTPIFNIKISYDNKMENINNDIEIVLPELTEENSIDFETLVESMMPEIPEMDEEMSTIIIVDDEFLDLANKPLFIDDRLFVSSRDIATALDADLDWNQSEKEITMSKDDTTLIFHIASDMAIKNGIEEELDSEVIVKDGTGFVPLRFTSENLGFDVEWDPASRMVFIYKR
jgi:copper amine oxidase-like protein